MSTRPLDPAPYTALIAGWLAKEQVANPVIAAVDHDPVLRRWYVRMRGEEKLITTMWMTLREMTVHFECYFMPAPEENIAACYEFLLRTNNRLFGVRFAIGGEDAVYLVGQLPLSALDLGDVEAAEAELDRMLGATYAYTEECFRNAMRIGFGARFKG